MNVLRAPHSRGSQGVTARLIHKEDDWDAIRPEWDALYAASPYASPPLDFAWLRGWWRIYGPTYGTGGLQIVTAWRGTRLVGVLPLYESRQGGSPLGARQLRFLSTGEAESEETCPDYLNTLCLDSEEEDCVDAVWNCVERLAWDHLELLDLPEESPFLRSRAFPGPARTYPRGTCPVADLAGGFEAYLRRLSSNSRQQARRLLREGERAGATFEIVPADQASGAFDDLVRLHQDRWTAEGKPGVFAASRFTTFHRELVREWLPGGRAILARLSLGGDPLAVLYGFVTGSGFDFYQSGVRRDGTGRLRSPGNLAHLLLIQALAKRGVTTYDFLRGASSYKKRLATRERQLVAVHVWRPTLRAATCHSVRLAARVTRRGLRFLRPERVAR
jgi:CelD/BcsL family acetyltransferase involved in cellulose biosynthesis